LTFVGTVKQTAIGGSSLVMYTYFTAFTRYFTVALS
jgi:hypothetical protein